MAKAFLVDSASYAPLCGSYTADHTDAFAGTYAINALNVDDSGIIAMVSADGACTLSVQVLDEGGEAALYTTSFAIEETLENEEVTVAVSGFTFPDYFMVRAVLQDAQGNALCNPYTTLRYTEAYEEFEALTPADFPDNTVLDFGDCGFGVLVDDITVVSATASDGTYTFSASAAAQEDSAVALMANDFNEGGFEPVKLSGELKAGPLTVFGSAAVELKVTAVYDSELWGDDYFEYETYTELGGTLKATLTAGVDTKEFDEVPEIPLFNAPVPIGTTGLTATLKASIPLNFKIEAGGTTRTAVSNASGSYALSMLPVGDYTFQISADTYRTETVTKTLKPGTNNTMKVELHASTGTVTGMVTDSETGEPIDAASVGALQDGTLVKAVLSKSDGSYTLELKPGTYTLTASATGYQTSSSTTVTVSENLTARKDFQLKKAGMHWMIEDGVLTIYGSGPIPDYNSIGDAPWHYNTQTITKIVIEDGITAIGKTRSITFYPRTPITPASRK